MTDDAPAEAVFWDIGGVVLAIESVQAAHREFVEELVAAYDTGHGVEEAIDRWRTTVGEHFRERDGTEFRSAQAGYQRAVDALVGEPVPESEWDPIFRRALEAHASPNEDAVEGIERLARTPVHLGVLSDVDEAEGRWLLEQFGVLEHFDAVTTSEEVGRTKPDPAMYEATLEKAGVEPANAVMIGDRYEHDIEGAAELGLTTVAYGADDGPAVDYRVDDLRELPGILGLDD